MASAPSSSALATAITMPAVFERAGGIAAFQLEPQFRAADALLQGVRADERCEALTPADKRGPLRYRQKLAVVRQQVATGGRCAADAETVHTTFFSL